MKFFIKILNILYFFKFRENNLDAESLKFLAEGFGKMNILSTLTLYLGYTFRKINQYKKDIFNFENNERL